jgi:hypothetical protein
MNVGSLKQVSYTGRVSSYAKSHWVSLGLFLAAYGVFYLSSVILNFPLIKEWGRVAAIYSPTSISPLLSRSFIDYMFFSTSFPALVVGAVMLCTFCIRKINLEASVDKQYVAILLTVFGFAYQILGAWPLQHQPDLPWQWQKQIDSFGPIFAWILYLLSLFILSIGVISLYKHSLIYHNRKNSEENKNGKTVA